jgi:hypothetical protein
MDNLDTLDSHSDEQRKFVFAEMPLRYETI